MKVYPIGFSQNPLLLRKMMPIFEVHHVILIWFAIYAEILIFKMFFLECFIFDKAPKQSNELSYQVGATSRRRTGIDMMLLRRHGTAGYYVISEIISWAVRAFSHSLAKALCQRVKTSYSRSQMICDWLCDGLPADACERMCVLSVWFSRALMSI